MLRHVQGPVQKQHAMTAGVTAMCTATEAICGNSTPFHT
jgi:hypothetical protein